MCHFSHDELQRDALLGDWATGNRLCDKGFCVEGHKKTWNYI